VAYHSLSSRFPNHPVTLDYNNHQLSPSTRRIRYRCTTTMGARRRKNRTHLKGPQKGEAEENVPKSFVIKVSLPLLGRSHLSSHPTSVGQCHTIRVPACARHAKAHGTPYGLEIEGTTPRETARLPHHRAFARRHAPPGIHPHGRYECAPPHGEVAAGTDVDV
jgi:hypothetical protein